MSTINDPGHIWGHIEETNVSNDVLALMEEASRIKSRLDHLDAVLQGDENEWMTITKDSQGEIVLKIDSALREARQQANVLRSLLNEINQRTQGDDNDTGDLFTFES